jgi:hypothetical protein
MELEISLSIKGSVEEYRGEDLCGKTRDWKVMVSLTFETNYCIVVFFYLVVYETQHIVKTVTVV